MKYPYSTLARSLIEAAIIAGAAALLALLVNVFHPNPIPLFATEAYQTMVPCPVQEGHVTPISATAKELKQKRVLFVDAREASEFKKWHFPGALSLTYDFLDPIPEEDLRKIAEQIAARQAARVVVYGDGSKPDTGKLLGIDISAAGIKNVFYVTGGAAALQNASPKPLGRTI
jgi:predicted sulfurtransferase